MKINIITNKTKSIKERNVKNQITKHNIQIISKVELINLSNMKSKNSRLQKTGILTWAQDILILLTMKKN